MNKKYNPSFWKHHLRQKCSINTKKFSSLTDKTSIKLLNLIKALSFDNINPFRIFDFFNNSMLKTFYDKKIIKNFCNGDLLNYADMLVFLNTNSKCYLHTKISFDDKRLVDLQHKECSRPLSSCSLIFLFHVSLQFLEPKYFAQMLQET